MMSFLFNFFVPSKHYDDLKSFAKIEYIEKTKIIVSLNLFIVLVLLLLTIIRFSQSEFPLIGVLLLPLAAGLILASLFYLRKTGNCKMIPWLLLVLSLTILPIRIYQTGGLVSPVLSWVFGGIVVMSVLHRRRVLYFYAIAIPVELLIIQLLNPPEFYFSPLAGAISPAFAFSIILYVLVIVLKSKDKMVNENKRLEKDRTAKLMIRTLSHEINNPLTIANGRLRILQKEIKKSQVDISTSDISDALMRIEKVVANIREVCEMEKVVTEKDTTDTQFISAGE